MQNDENGPSRSKTKIIASLVVIAAIAIIYFVTSALTHKNITTPVSDAQGQSQTKSTTTNNGATTNANSTFKDGTYMASGSYRTPQTTETIDVTVTVKGGVVTDSSVQQTPQAQQAVQYQADFKNNYQPLVVGKKLTDIHLSRVAGSSLTSGGFNTALEAIKSQATTQG